MLVTNLRKMAGHVVPPCYDMPIALLGTETGPPVSNGVAATISEGAVIADGSGYDFINGVLIVDTKPGCIIPPHTTLTISGKGPVPDLSLCQAALARYIVGVISGQLWAAYNGFEWAITNVPASVAPGTDYSLVVVVGNTYVRAWLNGSSIGRRTIPPTYIQTPLQWQLRVGEYFGGTTYTGRVNSVTWEVGALYPDVANI